MRNSSARFDVRAFVTVVFLSIAAGSPISADVIDPSGDFLSTYTGPPAPDLDVLSAKVTFNSDAQTFTFTATLAGAVGTSEGTVYIFGLDRGAGVARFAAIGIDQVKFDSVVVLSSTGGTVRDLVSGQLTQTLLPTDLLVSGPTITATVNASSLISQGLALNQFTWDLWPRLGTGNNNQISDFAPDNANVRVETVPEPGSLLLLGLGFAGLASYASVRRHCVS